jgi:hypothetical protein
MKAMEEIAATMAGNTSDAISTVHMMQTQFLAKHSHEEVIVVQLSVTLAAVLIFLRAVRIFSARTPALSTHTHACLLTCHSHCDFMHAISNEKNSIVLYVGAQHR